MSLNDGQIFGICNPLLDICCKVDGKLLEKYNLNANSAILGDDSHLKIYDDLKHDYVNQIEYIPGGSGQNSLRTASWILNQPNVCTYMGCVGKDGNAEIMKKKANEQGLNAVYQVCQKNSTGTCAVLITGQHRSLIAHLAAANNFTIGHFDDQQNWSLIEKAKIVYVTGFFFTVCPQAIMKLANFALDNNRTFAINLSAPFISQFFKDPLLAAIPYVDLLFGNDDEAKAFAKNCLNTDSDDVIEIAKSISKMSKLNNKPRVVIITQGHNPVIFVTGDVVKSITVKKIEDDKIVDTNGAGDAFVGGFLSQFVKDQSIEKCIDCGIWASGLVIQRSGCTFPEKMDYN